MQRILITGRAFCLVYIQSVGTLVNWESKTQHVATLSSTEAEYISLAKGACENNFISMLLEEVMQYPKEEKLVGRVYKDNLGAIYLVKNPNM